MNLKAAVVLALGVSAAPLATAHTLLSKIYIDEVSQGDGTCLRMPEDGSKTTSPVDSLESDDMACGANGDTPAAFVCPAPAGATLTFEFRTWPDASNPGAIDPSHVGPCSIYVKKVDDPLNDPASGAGWVKLWHEGYNEDTGKWCVDNLIANNGLLSFELPSGLAKGNYLVRSEILALHQAYSKGDPQYYVSCAQVHLCKVIQSRCEDGDFEGPPEVELEEVTNPAPGYIPKAVNSGAADGSYEPSGTDFDGKISKGAAKDERVVDYTTSAAGTASTPKPKVCRKRARR
ncbi:endoglucanase II [Verticillium alfalfae VaMs.102]|uniref:lytic cellulose monooxygenase (C4-dehydrogenating) n=1 Tax=Verticillium alfalfae (strain VaMs.102 / ATCC MYA-4576 / FGSC 10136) TaxID=526221 RepID=C9S7S4_VERA1|nr:endoglucanase II [Verticillium alfalfae VaMs.102]EEY14809.1 endoglucanase II [Verticillium alfalfae VaMs.102]